MSIGRKGQTCPHCGVVMGPGKKHFAECPLKGQGRPTNSGAMILRLKEQMTDEAQSVAAVLVKQHSRSILRLAALTAPPEVETYLTKREETTYAEILASCGTPAADAWRKARLAAKGPQDTDASEIEEVEATEPVFAD